MQNDGANQQYVASIGLDWGDQEHAIALQAAGSDQVETYTVKQTPESLHDWVLSLRNRFDGRNVIIAIEQSRGAVINALLGYGFVHVLRVPPKSLARYREAFYPSGAKDDIPDASLLLEWARDHRDKVKVWIPDKPETRALQKLTEFRRDTVGRRIAITNMLTQSLKEYFPQALSWAGDLDTHMACDFLEKWPTLEKLQKAKPAQIRRFYEKHGSRRKEIIQQRLEGIHLARPLTQDPTVISTSITVLKTLVPQLRCLIDAISRIDAEIKELFGQHEDRDIFHSFPGAGPVMAPRLLAAMGSDRSRYYAALEVQQHSGIAPVTERSGKSKWVHRRFACAKFVRQSFHEFAGLSIQYSPWARAYYQMQRDKGKDHHAAVRALAYKWIRIIFRCWKERAPYNEEIYLEALRRKNAPLLELLAPAA
jgi:hypothetical protein